MFLENWHAQEQMNASLLQLIQLGTTQFLASTAITILVQHVHTLMSSKV